MKINRTKKLNLKKKRPNQVEKMNVISFFSHHLDPELFESMNEFELLIDFHARFLPRFCYFGEHFSGRNIIRLSQRLSTLLDSRVT